MIVDKLTAESQVYGGIIMGLGFALFENRILDRNTAKMVNPNMEWYLLPGMSDIPEIDVTLVDQPDRGVDRARRAAGHLDRRGDRQRGGERHRRAGPETAAHARHGAGGAPAKNAREGRCEAFRLRQRGQREGSGRGARPRARQVPAARRRHGPARADEGLHRDSPSGWSTSRTSTARSRARRTAACGSARRSRSTISRTHADAAAAVSRARPGGGGSRHAADPERRHRRRQPESASAVLVLPQRGVRLPEEGRLALLRGGRREPVPRDLRRRAVPHRPSVEPGGARGRARREVPRRRSGGRAGGRGRPTTSRCRTATCLARRCSRRTSC